jgi:hypothetical protein
MIRQSVTALCDKVTHGGIGPRGQAFNLCAPVRRLPKSLVSARRVATEIPRMIRHKFFWTGIVTDAALG